MNRGQLEASFQWLFVLIAGIAFLVMFFFLIKGCTSQGEQRIQGLAVDTAARRIESAVWQPPSTFNMSIQPVEVRCPAGTLTFTSDAAAASVDRAPVFLPPSVADRLQIVTKEVILTGEVAPPIRLGNVLFGIDEETYYLLVKDGSGEYPLREQTVHHPNIRSLLLDDITNPLAVAELVPRTARAVVIVANNEEGYVPNTDVSLLDENMRVMGVSVRSDKVTFFARREGKLEKQTTLSAETPELVTGAIISTDSGSYRCGRENFAERLKFLTRVYQERIDAVIGYTPLKCMSTYTIANATLAEINAKTGEPYLDAFFLKDDDLIDMQESLLRQSCPVIA